ncbi:LCP family protein [Jatrophihabitans endophyticus]|uniref:LCP family protein n=1 Tax=Jatrophihabitans endophyticus TaxID=1206085 RepID=UPI0019E4FDC4|nr:LCP family protein [Jatrophihabitans endophyticus]MBE7187985.1 LCP family protein [Jatrophihabitans endophyticus]
MSSSGALPPHLDPRGRHRGGEYADGSVPRGARSRSLARPIGRVLGALLSLTLLAVAGYSWNQFREINAKVPRLAVNVDKQPSGSTTDIDGKDQNILLVGNDDRSTMTAAESKELHASPDGGSLNTDTMMIVHIPADGAKATLISLPRDSYVHIKGHGTNRLNSAYADGYNSVPSTDTLDQKRAAGANLLVSTITNLTGLTINHYVQVDLLGFYRISNAIGGVSVNLCHAVNDTHKANRAAGLTGGSGLKLSAGHHVLQGVQALEFVRQRHFLPRGDLDRIRRQQYFLTAAFRKIASVGIITKIHSLGTAVEQSLYLDKGLNLVDLAEQLQNLSANNIVSKTIPTANEVIDGMDVLRVKPARVKKFIDHVITAGTTSTPSSSHPSTSTTKHPKSGSAKPTKKSSAIDSKCID